MACGVRVLKFFNGDRTKGEGWGWCVVKTHTHFFKIFGNFSFRYHPYYHPYLTFTLHIPCTYLFLHISFSAHIFFCTYLFLHIPFSAHTFFRTYHPWPHPCTHPFMHTLPKNLTLLFIFYII